jgi:excisionase family DNA binding protein
MNKSSYSVGEVALRFDISAKCVRLAIHRGELSALRFNQRTLRVPAAAVEAWADRARQRATAPVARKGKTGCKGNSSGSADTAAGSSLAA